MFKKTIIKLKEKLNKINEDDSGSAFIFVVIGVMFVSIVGATVMSLATNYVTTVIVDHYSTDNFYQTEGYLAEIRSGIEELAGEENEKAYLDVVEHYSSPKMTSKMKTVYGKKYLTGLVRKLNNDAVEPTETTTEVVNVETTKTTDWKQLSMDKIKAMSTNPDTLSSSYGTGDLRYRFNYDDETKKLSLTIRGLVIKYTDETGYHSNIQTDINIGVPDYGFEGNSTYDQLKHYITISDDILSVNTSGNSNAAQVTGSVYSGTAKSPLSSENSDDTSSGIEISTNTKAVFNSKQIISRGNLNIFSGADVTMNGLSGLNSLGDLWLKNIILRAPATGGTTAASKLNIYDNSYILDDTSIEDNNATVNIGGNYYGYSYNKYNDGTEGSLRSDYSSAILVNGQNTTLTSDNLMKLILAGRTFVQRNEEQADGSYQDSLDDIMMGESLAVKSNQIAYLVPEKYIVGEHNPLAEDEIDPSNILASVNTALLENDADIWPYLNQSEPVSANFNNSGKYVFLYLNFASESKANDYFSNYYSKLDENGIASNKENLDDKAEAYIATLNGSMKISPALYLIAGNIIHDYYNNQNSGSKQQSANYYDGTGNPNSVLLADGNSKMKNYLGLQRTLVPSGSEGIADVRDGLESPDSELVCDVILNIDTGGTSTSDDNQFMRGTETLPDVSTTVPGHSDWHLVFQNGNYTVPTGISKGLILCAKDVTVSSDFEGLIIAGGKVSITSSGSYKANVTMMGEILDLIKNDKTKSWWKYFRCLDDNEKTSVNVADCISYENWERNSN